MNCSDIKTTGFSSLNFGLLKKVDKGREGKKEGALTLKRSWQKTGLRLQSHWEIEQGTARDKHKPRH